MVCGGLSVRCLKREAGVSPALSRSRESCELLLQNLLATVARRGRWEG